MHLGRICLLLVTLAALRVTITGGGNEGLLITIIGFALCLGLCDRKLQPSDQAATRRQFPIGSESEDPDDSGGQTGCRTRCPG